MKFLNKIFGKPIKEEVVENSAKPFKEVLNEIQLRVHTQLLKENGFKKHGRTFNKINENGFVEVINFQSGQYQLDNATVIPGVNESFYGSFTINIGVLIPEFYYKSFPKEKVKKVYQEYDCAIRTRLGSIIKDGSDRWWDLSEKNKENVISFISGYLEKEGMEWLNKLNTRQKVYENWPTLSTKYNGSLVAKLDIARLKILNDEDDGKNLFIDYYNTVEDGPHKRWLIEEAKNYSVNLKKAPNNK